MTDTHSKEVRSKNMSHIRSTNEDTPNFLGQSKNQKSNFHVSKNTDAGTINLASVFLFNLRL